MSRFFYGSDTSSESSDEDEVSLNSEGEEKRDESEEESEEESDEEDESEEESSDEEGVGGGANRFLKSDDESEEESDEGEQVTIVKSAKDKRFDELEGIIRLIENAQKINDWNVINERRLCTGV